MKIAIFGCSWTHGVGQIEKYINWPYFFAQKYPNAEITIMQLQQVVYLFKFIR